MSVSGDTGVALSLQKQNSGKTPRQKEQFLVILKDSTTCGMIDISQIANIIRPLNGPWHGPTLHITRCAYDNEVMGEAAQLNRQKKRNN